MDDVILTAAILEPFVQPRTWTEVLALAPISPDRWWRHRIAYAEELGLLRWSARPDAARRSTRGVWSLTDAGRDYVQRRRPLSQEATL